MIETWSQHMCMRHAILSIIVYIIFLFWKKKLLSLHFPLWCVLLPFPPNGIEIMANRIKWGGSQHDYQRRKTFNIVGWIIQVCTHLWRQGRRLDACWRCSVGVCKVVFYCIKVLDIYITHDSPSRPQHHQI